MEEFYSASGTSQNGTTWSQIQSIPCIDLVIPFTASQTWGCNETFTYNSSGNGNTYAGSFNTDGSYPWQNYSGNGYSVQQSLKSNGTGSFTQNQNGYNPLTAQFGAAALSGSAYAIPVTIGGGNAFPATPAPATTNQVPDWYPTGKAAPKPMQKTPSRSFR